MTDQKLSNQKIIVGRKDFVNFPEIELIEIKVKVDTGAYTSSINCHHAEIKEISGKKKLECIFLDPEHENYSAKKHYFENYKTKKVKSSNGAVENRFLIKTEIEIFQQTWPIELTLTERKSMKHDVLLGRKFLNKKFVVDTAKVYLSQKNILKKI